MATYRMQSFPVELAGAFSPLRRPQGVIQDVGVPVHFCRFGSDAVHKIPGVVVRLVERIELQVKLLDKLTHQPGREQRRWEALLKPHRESWKGHFPIGNLDALILALEDVSALMASVQPPKALAFKHRFWVFQALRPLYFCCLSAQGKERPARMPWGARINAELVGESQRD